MEKYKKCCLLKEQQASGEGIAPPEDALSAPEELLEDPSFLFKAMSKARRHIARLHDFITKIHKAGHPAITIPHYTKHIEGRDLSQ